MFGQPHLEAAAKPPARIAHQMGETVVRHRRMPVQNGLGDARAGRLNALVFQGVAHECLINRLRSPRDQKSLAWDWPSRRFDSKRLAARQKPKSRACARF